MSATRPALPGPRRGRPLALLAGLAWLGAGLLVPAADGEGGRPAAAPAPAAPGCAADHASTPAVDCLRCHAPIQEQVERAVPHGPAADGDCDLCHGVHATRFEHLLNQRPRALCNVCHGDSLLAFQTGSVHTPVREGRCLDCHEVHGSEHEGLVRAEGNDLCLGCHEEKAAQLGQAVVHEPFGEGDCSDCHLTHNGPNADQLLAPPRTLCVVCHDAEDEALVEAHLGIPVAGTRCVRCHDPHASQSRGMLRPVTHSPFAEQECDMCHLVDSDTPQVVMATGGRLCAACHEGYPRSGDPHVHEPVGNGDCAACHRPHASTEAKLLADVALDLCQGCHQELVERRQTSRSAHPVGIAEVGCTSCHQPHSSKEPWLLNAGPIRTCLVCHESERHGHPLGSDRLDPRTGQPITCVTCHDPHGTDYPLQLRADQTRGLCLECHTGEQESRDRRRRR